MTRNRVMIGNYISDEESSTDNLIKVDPESDDNTNWSLLPGIISSPTISPLRRSLKRKSCDVQKLINDSGLSEEIEFDFEEELLVSNLTTPSYSMESISSTV